jgi:hypothetical protein
MRADFVGGEIFIRVVVSFEGDNLTIFHWLDKRTDLW